jgi:predicted Zn-ribbon and HTH transcriptional regulator
MSKKYTIDDIKEMIYNKYNGEYICLSNEYKNNKEKIKIKHNICNNIFEMRSGNFLNNNNRCPYCKNKNDGKTNKTVTKMTKEDFIKRLDNDYELVSDFINLKTNVDLLHKSCGNIYNVRPDNFLYNNHRCECTRVKHKYTIEDIQKYFNKINDYELISKEYVNKNEKLKIKHLSCDNIFEMSLNDFKNNNYRCPKCKASKGENNVRTFLLNNNIKFTEQKRFNDCKDKRTLPFDFYLEDYNICIEYDGELHYNKARYKNDEEYNQDKLNITKKHDEIKNEYCRVNNIRLIRIPYTEFGNIEKILKKELNINA